MSVSVITVGTQSVNLVSLPTTPAPASVQFDMADAVATVRSTFTGQMQAQGWPGADALSGTVTMPPLTQAQADDWIAFLMELRGMANAFQIGDPMKSTPRGTGGAGSVTAAAAAGSQSIAVSFGAGAILPGDYMQIGYRFYRALEGSGSGAIGIWPSVREALAGTEAITTANTVGLFRLATNKRTWSADFTRVTRLSFQIQEYR